MDNNYIRSLFLDASKSQKATFPSLIYVFHKGIWNCLETSCSAYSSRKKKKRYKVINGKNIKSSKWLYRNAQRDESTINGHVQISTLPQCVQARHISRGMLAIHFPGDEAREAYIQIRQDQRASKICGRGSGKSGNGAAGGWRGGYKVSRGMSYLRGDLVADQRS